MVVHYMTFPLVAFVTLSVSSTFSPGPNNIMCMTLGQNLGFKSSLKYMAGVILGYSTVLTLIAIFNSIISIYFPSVNNIFKILGAIYLFYLAIMIFFKSNKAKKDSTLIEENKLFITALFFQFINPKAILFGLSVFATYVFPYFDDIKNIASVIIFLNFLTFSSLSLWSGFGAILHNFIKNNEKAFNITMSGLLIYCALAILI